MRSPEPLEIKGLDDGSKSVGSTKIQLISVIWSQLFHLPEFGLIQTYTDLKLNGYSVGEYSGALKAQIR